MKLFRKRRIIYKPQNSGRIVTFHQFALTFQQYAISKISYNRWLRRKKKEEELKKAAAAKKKRKKPKLKRKEQVPLNSHKIR